MDRRPHVQGDSSGIEVEVTDEVLTDGAGLSVVRSVWDRVGLGSYLDAKLSHVGGHYRPSLHVEQWTSLLQYGGGCMDHLPLLESRGVRALFGWERVVDPTSFGRFLRRSGVEGARVVEEALRKVVRAGWDASGGVPRAVQLVLDSTVVVRYGVKQAGAEKGYNPKKKGHTSHHPLVAFLDTGDCLGVRWRPGNANTAAGAEEWIEELVGWLREQGVRRILVRLDKGFFRLRMIEKLKELGVDFVLKMQESRNLQCYKGEFAPEAEDSRLEVASSERWGVRMLCVRRAREGGAGELALGKVVVERQATVLTNLAVDPVTGWRMYNQGALVEQRIEELGQLGVGRTAVNDLGGNHLLWGLGALAYQLLHFARTVAMRRVGQVRTLRALVLRAPGKLVRHARTLRLKLSRQDAMTRVILNAISRLRSTAIAPIM
ncbi:MAG TPA: IS1380 family transposase [Armatimonadota bacterium]|nr:IS1380 family transposase [Armatimonadota bacterium]